MITISAFADEAAADLAGQIEVLTELVHRWTPEHMHQRGLEDDLVEVRAKTREFFDRVFR